MSKETDSSIIFRSRPFIHSEWREKGWNEWQVVGKRQKSEDIPTDVALQMAPLTDSRIIYENIAPGNGSTVLPCGKYGKFGSRGPFCRRSLAIFFPFHPQKRGNGRKKAEWKWKNREWVHFPRGWELASNPLSFIHHAITVPLPSPFTKSLAVLQSRCIAPSHSTRFLNLRIRRIAADLWICDEFFWYSEKNEMRI